MRVFFTILACCFISISFSQSIERVIVGSAGHTMNTGSLKLKTSVGEPIVGKIGSIPLVSVAQGFFTASSSIVTGVDAEDLTKGYVLYPNPVTDKIFIRGDLLLLNNVEINDITGRNLQSSFITGNHISMSSFAPGVYMVRLFNKQNKLLCIYKIIKL